MNMIENYELSLLSFQTDYCETAELIYNTDPFIYSDIFGDMNNAKKVLIRSFENADSVFYKKAVYIVKYRPTDEVVSVALCHSNDFKWNEDSMLRDFANSGVVPPRSFFGASEYMEKTYNYRKLGSSMCNISVKESFRRRGVGFYMLDSLLSSSDAEIIELTVLENNIAAIRLYEKLGFKIVGDAFDDYGGYNLPAVKSYKMIRNKPLCDI